MAEHLTRRDLKTDQVALTIDQATEYFGLHRRQLLQIGGAVLVAALLAVGIYFWMDHTRNLREEKLAEAMAVATAPVGASQPNVLSYPNQQAKDAAETKAFTDIATQFHGSKEGAVAEYTLAGLAAGNGKNDEARKRFQATVDSGSKEYASLAKLALAQLDFAENRAAEGEKLLRDLMDHPTAVVSKSQATISLARAIGKTRPEDARQLLMPMVSASNDESQYASAALADLPTKSEIHPK